MSELIKEASPDEAIYAEATPEAEKGSLAWVKSHKKQLIIVGISTIGIILGIKSKDSLKALWAALTESIKDISSTGSDALPATPTTLPIIETTMPTRAYTLPTEVFDVSGHIRTMAAGRHHSAKKAAEAAALGIELLPNQTLVDAYTKYTA